MKTCVEIDLIKKIRIKKIKWVEIKETIYKIK